MRGSNTLLFGNRGSSRYRKFTHDQTPGVEPLDKFLAALEHHHRIQGGTKESSKAPNGSYESWKDANGKYHRDGDQPASVIEEQDYRQEVWYQHGNRHRTNGPAWIKQKGNIKMQCWFQDDYLHREDGPARIMDNQKSWHRHGQLHRTDGPALIEFKSKAVINERFFIYGEELTRQEFENQSKN